jgi:hypothetical protein
MNLAVRRVPIGGPSRAGLRGRRRFLSPGRRSRRRGLFRVSIRRLLICESTSNLLLHESTNSSLLHEKTYREDPDGMEMH